MCALCVSATVQQWADGRETAFAAATWRGLWGGGVKKLGSKIPPRTDETRNMEGEICNDTGCVRFILISCSDACAMYPPRALCVRAKGSFACARVVDMRGF